MKTTNQHKAGSRPVSRGLLFVAVFLTALIWTTVSRAQTSAALAAKPATALSSSASLHTGNLPLSPAATTKPPAGGAREGVKIHGHWTIDVRNPDGTLDKHLDFENGLCTLSSLVAGGGLNPQAGDVDLASLLFGNIVPGPWQIILDSPVIPAFPAGGSPGPACGNLPQTSNAFILNQSNATALNAQFIGSPLFPLWFPVLSPPALTGSSNGILLAAQFTIPQGTSNTTITSVQANFGICLTNQYSASSCVSNFPGVAPFSGTYLTGTGAIPAPPTVSAGQTVAVSVQYSFQ